MLAITINLPIPGTYDITLTVQGAALLTAIATRLTSIEGQLVANHQQGAQLMEVTQQVREVLTEIDTATTELAARVEALIAKAVDSMDQGEADPLLAEARAISTRLRGIAANPEEPVPAPEPLPPGA